MLIPITDIIVPSNRQREEFPAADELELSKSIQAKGLFHAICVRPDGRTLVAGERRLRAIAKHLIPLNKTFTYGGQEVPVGMVPVVPVSSDDPLVLEEIELDENIIRKDLTWQERAKTVARINEVKAKRAAAEGREWTSLDLAKAVNPTKVAEAQAEMAAGNRTGLGSLQNTPRIEAIVAKHLDNPEVAKAKSVQDAFKLIKRQEEAQRVKELGISVGKTYSSAVHSVFNANCLEWMEGYRADELFDCILTDPPYGMGAHEFGDGAGRLSNAEHHYDDSYASWKALMAAWCPLAYQVTKPEAHAYVFCDIDRFHELKEFMQSAGWYVFRTPLINYKSNSGRVPLPDQGPRRQYEILLYAIKGKKRTTGLYSDVIASQADEQLSHGAQKPVSLYVDLLKRSVRPGDKVLDSFGGTGTLLPAAHQMKCRATVLEQSPTYYGLCLERLKGLDVQQELAV